MKRRGIALQAVVAPRQLPLKTIEGAHRSLDALRAELLSAGTYEKLKKIEKAAETIKFWYGDIEAIKHKAEDLIVDANVKLGEETKKLVRAKGGRPSKTRSSKGTGSPTIKEHGLTRKLVHRVQRLADNKQAVQAIKKRLREQGKDVTPTAVVREITQGDKKQRRATRERELATKQLAMPDKFYGVIYADPPWRFTSYSVETGMDRAADNHYPTMDVEGIAALKVPAAADCVLFLWATVPMLPQALQVMQAWGFEYKSHFAWMKDKAGTGFWNKNRHELLLVGTRGSIPAPAPGEQFDSVIEAPRGAHSAKPFAAHEMIEVMFPNLPRVELFAREQFAGWDAWGNEAPREAAE